MDLAAFALSLFLLIAAAVVMARRMGRTPAERFWLAVGVGALNLGAGITLLSLFRAVAPLALLIYQAIVCITAFALTRHPLNSRPRPRRRPRRLAAAEKALLLALGAMMFLTAFEQFFLPVSNTDDRNYRAARAAYWLQHRSIFGWDAHNDRQVAFPPGGSLPFFYGVLFTRNENAGLVVTWSAYPLVAVGAYQLLRSLRQTRIVSLLGAAAFSFTPIVLLHTRGVQPELWLTLYTLGCAFWSVRSLRRRRSAFAAAVACVFAVLAINVRATALPLLVMTLLVALLRPSHHLRRLRFSAAGAVVALLLSGLLPTLIFNLRHFGHPLGSQSFRHIHSAETSTTQLRAHAARTAVVLIEPPFVPEPLRARLERGLAVFMRATGGDAWLPRENQPWPGHFAPEVRRWAENYSLAGLLLLPLFAIATWRTLCALLRGRVRSFDVLAILAIPFFLAIVLMVRWMGVIGRFWIAPYALGVVMASMLLAHAAWRHRWIGVASIVLLFAFAVPAAIHRAMLLRDIVRPESPVALDEPYAEPLAHIPSGSTILLAAGQGTRDYPLFQPRNRFSNRVVSWGKQGFDAARFQRIIERESVTHVIIENDRQFDLGWDSPLPTADMVAWLTHAADFREIPLPYTPHMRLFARQASN